MAHKSADTRPARIWSFALPKGPLSECAATVERQFQLAADYYRTLTEIEIERLRRYRAARTERFHTLGFVEQLQREAEAELALKRDEGTDDELTALKTKTKLAREAAKRARSAIDPDQLKDFNNGTSFRLSRIQRLQRDGLADAEAQLQSVQSEKNSSAKRAAIAAVEHELSQLPESELSADEWADIAVKKARATHGPAGLGLCTGSYMRVEERVQQSIRTRRKAGLDPEVRRWFGEGILGVHIQGGRVQDSVFEGSDTQLRITPQLGYPERFKMLWLKGPGSTWMQFPLLMHRALPPTAHIAGAYVSRKLGSRLRDGKPRYQYNVCLVLRENSFNVAITPKHVRACGINFGFRHLPDGGPYRHAYLVDSNGRLDSLELPEDIMRDFRRADGVRSARDTARDAFSAWALATIPEALPQGFVQWKSCNRMEDFARHLANTGSYPQYENSFRTYDKQSRHLYEYENGLREQTCNRRDEHYRLVARDIARRYTYVFVDDQGMDELKRRQSAPPGMGEARDIAARQFQYVAPGSFRNALKLMTSNNGSIYHEVDAVNISRICHVCYLYGPDPKWALNVKCDDGHVADVDERAAANVLARGEATCEGPAPLAESKNNSSDAQLSA